MARSYYQLLDQYPNFFEEQGYGAPAKDYTATPQFAPTPEQAKILLGANQAPARNPAAQEQQEPTERDEYDFEELTDDELLELSEDRGLASGPGTPSRQPGFDVDSRGTAAMEEAMQLAGMSQSGVNRDPELMAKIKRQQDAQESALGESESIYEELKAMPKRPDLTPLLNLTDTWTGSKMAQGYQAPATPEGRLGDLLKFSDVLNKQRDQYTDSLIKQATSGSNSTMWRSLANLKARRTRNAEEDLHRIAKDLAPAATMVSNLADLNKEVGGFNNPNATKDLEGIGSWMDENSHPLWQTERGTKIKMLADTALTEYTKLVTGLNATDAERAAYKQNLGRSLFPSRGSALQGMKNLQKLAEAIIEARQAGFSEDTVQLYESQNGPTLNRFRKLMGQKANMTPSERRARIEQLKAMKAQALKGKQ